MLSIHALASLHLVSTVLTAAPASAWYSGINPGILGGVLGGGVGLMGAAIGTIGGICAPRGKFKSGVMGLCYLCIAIGVVSLALGVAALIDGAPYGIWYSFLLCGLIATSVVTPITFVFRVRYRQAELRQLSAQEFRST